MIIIIFHWRFWHAALTSNIWDLAVSQHLIRELCHKEVNERQTFSKDVCCLVACCIKMVLWGPARKAQMLVHLSMQKSDIFVNIQNKKKRREKGLFDTFFIRQSNTICYDYIIFSKDTPARCFYASLMWRSWEISFLPGQGSGCFFPPPRLRRRWELLPQLKVCVQPGMSYDGK